MTYLNKKGAIESRAIIYIAMAVVAILIIIFAIIAYMQLREKAKETEVLQLEQELKSLIGKQKSRFGSVNEETFTFPPGTDMVCFVDLSKKEEALRSPVINAFPLMKSSLESGAEKNVFIIDDDEVKDTMDVGDICFDCYPNYMCFDVGLDGKLTLQVEGRGACTLVVAGCEECIDTNINPLTKKPSSNKILDFNNLVKLNILKDVVVDFPPPGLEQGEEKPVCIEAVPFDTPIVLSEVYNISPAATGFPEQKPSLEMKFYPQILPPQTSLKTVKIKYFNFTDRKWYGVPTVALNERKRTILANIDHLGHYVVFGPEAPTAIISHPGDGQVFGMGENVIFDGSKSFDLDGDELTYHWDLNVTTIGPGDRKIVNTTYYDIGFYPISLTVSDGKVEDTDTITIQIAPRNTKQLNLYLGKPVFMFSRAEDKRDILQMIPLAIWNDGGTIRRFPLLGFNAEPGATIEDYKFDEVRTMYNSSVVRLFFDGVNYPAGISAEDETGTDLTYHPFYIEDYSSYWLSHEDIVLVDYDVLDKPGKGEKIALLSSLFASFVNAPIFFVNEGNFLDHRVVFENSRKAYVIGYMPESILNELRSVYQLEITRYYIDHMTSPFINPLGNLFSHAMPSGYVQSDINAMLQEEIQKRLTNESLLERPTVWVIT